MIGSGQRDYDVAIVSDLRYPGGNSSSLVEEIKAQAAAGYTTALVHLPAPHMRRRRSFNHKLIHCLAPASRRSSRSTARCGCGRS